MSDPEKPAPRKIILPEDDKALLAECEVEAFRATGPGGQHVNTSDTAVRLKHRPTGLVATCRTTRSQYLNKKTCLKKLREKVEKLNRRPKRRIPTRKPRAARKKVLEDKAKLAEKKQRRRPPTPEE